MDKPLFLILPLKLSKLLAGKYRGISGKVGSIIPGFANDLRETNITLEPDEYIGISLLNAGFLFVLFFGLLFFVYQISRAQGDITSALYTSLLYAGLISIMFLAILLHYPRILAGKKAERIDKSLVFALKDLLLQISAGVPLYTALISVSKQGYGEVSKELKRVARRVNAGIPMQKALEELSERSRSEFLKRTTWQLSNTLRAGASLKGALRSIIAELTINQRSKIKDYAQELNLWSLLYMLFAVAVPTIGATMLVILSSFAGAGITKGTFIFFLIISYIVQIALIGFVKTRRPMVSV